MKRHPHTAVRIVLTWLVGALLILPDSAPGQAARKAPPAAPPAEAPEVRLGRLAADLLLSCAYETREVVAEEQSAPLQMSAEAKGDVAERGLVRTAAAMARQVDRKAISAVASTGHFQGYDARQRRAFGHFNRCIAHRRLAQIDGATLRATDMVLARRRPTAYPPPAPPRPLVTGCLKIETLNGTSVVRNRCAEPVTAVWCVEATSCKEGGERSTLPVNSYANIRGLVAGSTIWSIGCWADQGLTVQSIAPLKVACGLAPPAAPPPARGLASACIKVEAGPAGPSVVVNRCTAAVNALWCVSPGTCSGGVQQLLLQPNTYANINGLAAGGEILFNGCWADQTPSITAAPLSVQCAAIAR